MMNQQNQRDNQAGDPAPSQSSRVADDASPELIAAQRRHRAEWLRWWLKQLLQPLLLAVVIVAGVIMIGVAQRVGWIETTSETDGVSVSPVANVTYICPMMCTAPQTEPGRCPVCAMDLVPAANGASPGGQNFIEIDPVARRIANIQTVPARAGVAKRRIEVIGEIAYDETRLRTIAAYFDGRVEQLAIDYTGATVSQHDPVATVYSPQLYLAQVEYLNALELDQQTTPLRDSSSQLRVSLADSSRSRLIELGMTTEQVQELETTGQAESRLELRAPIGGTIIEKYVVEGTTLSEGEPICDLADLSNVWLMLELFPEDATLIRYGQQVEAEVQSLPGFNLEGRVAFVDTEVDPVTRTVSVRVDLPNPDGQLRIGDFGRATLRVSVGQDGRGLAGIYDPSLADRWICPKHPLIVTSHAETCEQCQAELVKTSDYGYIASPEDVPNVVQVPRNAVLMAGHHSVVYVETTTGRFELREVVLGPVDGGQIAILAGVDVGELVATGGNFLIDSQMQLAGNPSLIDPTKTSGSPPIDDDSLPPEVLEALAGLSESDRQLAIDQRICPVTEMLLGSMGVPPKIEVEGREILLCCAGCESRMRADADTYFAILERNAAERLAAESQPDPKIVAAMSALSPEDRELAELQVNCPVADYPLGGMGVPIKVDVEGVPVFICCEGCRTRLLADPPKYLAKLESIPESVEDSQPANGRTLPPIGPIQMMDDRSPSRAPPIPLKSNR